MSSDVDIIARVTELQLRPETPARLQALIAQDADLDDLVSVVGSDQILATRLLAVANRATSARREIRSIDEALLRIGRRGTVDIAWALSLHVLGGESPLAQELRAHAMDVALAARVLADAAVGVNAEAAFTAGLLHDIGAQLLLVAEPNDYPAFIGMVDLDGQEMLEIERHCFGIDHAEAGARCLRHWDLPETLVNAVERHHDVRERVRDGLEAPVLARIIAVSEHFVGLHREGFGWPLIRQALRHDPLFRALEAPIDCLADVLEKLEESVELAA